MLISAENCDEFLAKIAVAPYVGAWIETSFINFALLAGGSLPTWERGLKQQLKLQTPVPQNVAPYVGAWIETTDVVAEQLGFGVAPYVGAWIETQ